MSEFVVTGALLVDGREERSASLRVADGRIVEVLPPDAPVAELGCEVIDGRGRWLIPGGLDPHVHFALPVGDQVTADDFASGSRAALAGGTTTVIDFVTPARGQSLVAATEARLAETASANCDVLLHGSVTSWHDGAADDLRRAVAQFGLRSLKLYLAYLETIGLDDDALLAAMEVAAELDLTVLLHCEVGAEVTRGQQALLAAGETAPSAHPRSRPPAVEAAAVTRALELAARAGCRPYVVHVSCRESVAVIEAARARGQEVLAETCPQYLWLDDTVYDGDFASAARAVISPPLRSDEQLTALGVAVTTGAFDTLATDHCAFTDEQKARGRDDFTRIPGGAAGVQHRLSLTHTLLVASRLMTPSAWVRLVSQRAAEIFGLFPRKGSLDVGADADLVLWDPRWQGVIRGEDDLHPGSVSVFEGAEVWGRAERVWRRGRLVQVGSY